MVGSQFILFLQVVVPILITVIIFFRAIMKMLGDSEQRSFLGLSILTLLLGTVVYRYVEGWRWLDAFYFSVVTLTTIGFGEFAPSTDIGKIFTIMYIFLGLGILWRFIIRSGMFLKKQEEKKVSQNSDDNRKASQEDSKDG